MTGTPTVYVEHSALVHVTERSRLHAILKGEHPARLVVSDWSLIEIANGSDRAQALQRAEFLDGLEPLWLMERLAIERREVKNFLWQGFYKEAAEPFEVLTPRLSVMLSYTLGSRTPLGATARSWVLHLLSDQPYLKEINDQKKLNVDALLTLQKATKQRRKKHEPEIFRQWVFAMAPDRAPDGTPLTRAQKIASVEFCYEHREQFYRQCPTMAVEDALYQVRPRDPKRVPQQQDAIDFQHSAMALPHCDYVVTRDRNLAHVAEEAAKLLKGFRLATVCRGIDALARNLGADC